MNARRRGRVHDVTESGLDGDAAAAARSSRWGKRQGGGRCREGIGTWPGWSCSASCTKLLVGVSGRRRVSDTARDVVRHISGLGGRRRFSPRPSARECCWEQQGTGLARAAAASPSPPPLASPAPAQPRRLPQSTPKGVFFLSFFQPCAHLSQAVPSCSASWARKELEEAPRVRPNRGSCRRGGDRAGGWRVRGTVKGRERW